MSEFFGRRTPGFAPGYTDVLDGRQTYNPDLITGDRYMNDTSRDTQNLMSMLNSYFESLNISKALRETTTAFVLGLQGMQRNLVALGMRQVFDQLEAGADTIDNPLRGGFIGGLGQLELYAPELYEFFDDIFGDNDTISNIEFGSAFGIPEEKLPFTESALLEAVSELPKTLTDGNDYELSDEDKATLLGSDPTEVDLEDYVNARYVTAAEAASIMREEGYSLNDTDELKDFTGQRNQADTTTAIEDYVDPLVLSREELEAIAAEQGYKLNAADIENWVGQSDDPTGDPNYQTRIGDLADSEFDRNAVTRQELIDMSNDPNVGYVFSQEELEDLVGNTDEAALKDKYDLLGTSRRELRDIALDEGYRIEDLTEEEIESLIGNVKESKAVDLIDPRATSVVEVQEAVKNRTGDDISTTAAQQILTTIRDENDLESNVPISEDQLNTHVKESIELNIQYQIERITTPIRNLIFGTGPGGKPKTVLEIMDEILEQRAAGPAGMGVPIKVTFDPAQGTWAELKIPVPFPVNGPPIKVPLYDAEGNYIGPSSAGELLVDPTTGVITQVTDNVSRSVGQVTGNAVQIFDAAGEIIRSVPLGLVADSDWEEGDYNPFELDPDNTGDIVPQTDENGNQVKEYGADGLPIYEQSDDDKDENDEETPTTASPYDVEPGATDSEAAEDFYGSFPDDVDPNSYVTQQQLADAIDALDIPEDTVRTDEEIKNLAQGIIDELDLPEDTQISDEDLASAIGTYLTDNGYITEDTTRSDEDINTLIGEALTDYATVQGVQDTLDTYFGEDGTVTATLTALGYDTDEIEDILGTPAGYVDPITGEVTEEATGVFAAIEGAATPQDIINAVGIPPAYDDAGELVAGTGTGLYGEMLDAGATINDIEEAIGNQDEGTGLYGYIDAAVEDLATTEDVERIVGVPDLDEEGNLTDKSTGVYLEFYEAGLDYDTAIDLIGTPDDPNTPNVDEGSGLYGYVDQGNQSVRDYIDTVLGDVPGQITSISGFLGTPGAEVDDPDTEIDETLPTGLFATIEANRAAGETERDAIIDAINTFTSDGQYTIEQVLTAISDSNTDLKDFIGSPGADVDDPNTDVDETLPTGIYAGIAGSESTILDAISESEDNTDEYLTYISNIIGIPASEITQEDVDGIVGLLGDDEAITEINNDIRLYDANFDGVINDIDIGLLQGFVDAGVEGVGEIPATGLYSDAARRQFELQGYIDDSAEITQGLIAQEGKDTRQLVGQTALFNAMMSAGDAGGRRVDVSTPDPARINYIYDFSDVFATPQQKGLFPSPYGGPQRAQQQQIAQKRSIMSGPLQIGGMAQGGKVDYDFTDEIMQIMSYGDNQ